MARLYFGEFTLGHVIGHTEAEFGQRIVNSGFMLALPSAPSEATRWGGVLR